MQGFHFEFFDFKEEFTLKKADDELIMRRKLKEYNEWVDDYIKLGLDKFSEVSKRVITYNKLIEEWNKEKKRDKR